MRKILFLLISVLVFHSCTLEDDIDEMFVGKTWYMTGAKFNGTEINSDVKNFYTYGREGYKLTFQSSTFIGEFSTGDKFSGKWNVDPKARTMYFIISEKPAKFTSFDHSIFAVLKDVKYYKGDSHTLELHSDKDNLIRFNHER